MRALFIGPVGDPWCAGQSCRRGADSGRGRTRESPSPSRGRGRPRQAGPACRWAAGEEAEAGWAGKEEGKRAGVRFPGPREEKEKEEGLGRAENELGKRKRFCIFLRRTNTFN